MKKLDSSPTDPGWYWCCEGYEIHAMYMCHVSQDGGHKTHELSYAEAAEFDAQWWGPIAAPRDPELYGIDQDV